MKSSMVRLTYANKRKWNPIIVRQTGYYCFFCKCPNTPENPLEYGHLNGNEDDSRPENLAYMCKVCNNKMKFDYDMKFHANDQLIKNEKAVYACESIDATEDTSQQETARINKQLAYTFLLEHTMNGDDILLSDTTNAITNLCYDNNKTGSQAATRRYIDQFSNPINGIFVIFIDHEGKKRIKRKESRIEERN